MSQRTGILAVLVTLAALSGTVRAQESAARFDAPIVISDELHRIESLLDLDGDGDQDAVGWFWDAGTSKIIVTGWLNDGSGALVEAWAFNQQLGGIASGEPTSFQVGNLNADAFDDFAFHFEDRFWMFVSTGAGQPVAYNAPYIHPFDIQSILLADFDDDGKDDVALQTFSQTHIRLNQGSGLPFLLSDTFSSDSSDDVLRHVEGNGDGLPDIMLMNGARVELHLVAAGVMTGQTTLLHGVGGTQEHMPVTGDVDGDLDDDIVVFFNDDYGLLRRTGPSTWEPAVVKVGGPSTNLADVDGDGDLDGVCCSGGGGPPVNTGLSWFEIAINDGTGNFAPSFKLQGLGAQHIAGVSDLDSDGDADLVAGRVVYYADGPIAPRTSLASTNLVDNHFADCDGDGDPDVGFGLFDSMRNLADGTYDSMAVSFPAPPAGQIYDGPGTPGDFDGDGDTDLLVTRVEAGSFWPTIYGTSLLLNNGAGMLYDGGDATPRGTTMAPFVYTPHMDEPRASVVADADGDGDLDVLARTLGTVVETHLWWNDGNGSFTLGPEFPQEIIVAVADLNGDRFPDLVTAGSSLFTRLGTGAQAFAPRVMLNNATSIATNGAFAVGDLDDDGDVDIAGVHWNDELLVLHVNDGAGSFTPDITSFAAWPITGQGFSYPRVHAVDVDSDGLLDLVASPADNGRQSTLVFRKIDGAPGWHPPLQQSFEATGFSDVDGDGDTDAFLQEQFLNKTYEAPESGTRRQFGAGTAGTGGVVPVLGATGPFRQGEAAAIHMTGVPAGGVVLFALNFTGSDLPGVPWPGTTGYAWPWDFFFFLTVPGPGVLPGDGGISIPFAVSPLLAGIGPLYHQFYVFDAGHPFGHSSTAGLVVDYEAALP
jgi:hypothetical protein